MTHGTDRRMVARATQLLVLLVGVSLLGGCGEPATSKLDADTGSDSALAFVTFDVQDEYDMHYRSMAHAVWHNPEHPTSIWMQFDHGRVVLDAAPDPAATPAGGLLPLVPAERTTVWFRADLLRSHEVFGDDPTSWHLAFSWGGELERLAEGKPTCSLLLMYRASVPPSAHLHVQQFTAIDVRKSREGQTVVRLRFAVDEEGPRFPAGTGECVLKLPAAGSAR